MPHRNVWIRKHLEQAWDALPNKAEFIDKALSGASQAAPVVQRKPSATVTPDTSRYCAHGELWKDHPDCLARFQDTGW